MKSGFWNLIFPKAMTISRSEIFRKQEHKVSYRCSLPSPLQKRSKDQKGLHWCQNPAEDLLASTLKITRSSKTMDTCGALNSRSPLLGSGTNAILFDPWIFSAMAMAMSIYRTLCVLVSLKISLLEMLIAFGDSKTFTEGNFSTSGPPLFSSKFHFLRCSLIPPLPSFTGSTIFTSSHCKQAMLGFVSTSLALSC